MPSADESTDHFWQAFRRGGDGVVVLIQSDQDSVFSQMFQNMGTMSRAAYRSVNVYAVFPDSEQFDTFLEQYRLMIEIRHAFPLFL